MTSLRGKSGRIQKKATEKLKKIEDVLRTETFYENLSEEDLERLEKKYAQNGWIRLEGSQTIGFVSKCGEYFNCICKLTGKQYSFGEKELR